LKGGAAVDPLRSATLTFGLELETPVLVGDLPILAAYVLTARAAHVELHRSAIDALSDDPLFASVDAAALEISAGHVRPLLVLEGAGGGQTARQGHEHPKQG